MSTAPAEPISVEVVHALPHEQIVIPVAVTTPATVADAIERSGILTRFPELALAELKVGIYGRTTGLDEVLRDGDRVEIYRPLIADPKDARRTRAAGEARNKRRARSSRD